MKEITDTQIKIMDAALDLFSGNGIRSTTTRAIAERSGFNELTIFRNFGSKEGLLEAMIDHHFHVEDLAGSISSTWSGDMKKDLHAFVNIVRTQFRQREKIFQLMLRESGNEIVASKLRGFPEFTKIYAVESISSILGEQKRRDIDVETASIFFASYFMRSEMMRAMMGNDPFHRIDDRREEEVVEIFLKGILKGGAE
ncbi:MAG: TetR/AcrR family transcriptional regulator [Candidatus Thermoplasmatota archaeon]|nr:TetR/AcrR family transcriptional regulator [Candidatus Thermoplasmatota archaeon]